MISNEFTILLVENNPCDARLTKEVLKEVFNGSALGYKIHKVDNGNETFNFLNKHDNYGKAPTPDLVLLGLILPDISGMEILKYIKNDSLLKSIPVIMVSMSEEQKTIEEAYQNQVNAYITKPVHYTDYITALKSVMGLFGFK